MTDQATSIESSDAKPEAELAVCELKQFRYGLPCPSCGSDSVGYDGLLNLVCQGCGLRQGGAFT